MKLQFTMTAFGLLIPLMANAGTSINEVLKHVPEESAFVIVIPGLEELVAGLARFGKSAGIEELAEIEPAEVLKDPFCGHVEGLDLRGPFVASMQPGERKPVLIGTLLKPDTWRNRPGAEAIGEKVVTFEVAGEPWFAATIGKVGILAKNETTLRECIAPSSHFENRFAEHGTEMLEGQHVVVWADVARWQPLIEPLVTVGEGLLQMGLAMSDPKAEGNVAMWGLMFDQVRTLVRESKTYAASFRCSEEGVFARDLLTLNPDGEVAGYLQQVRRSDKDMLRGLPADRGMIVFASEWLVPPEVPTLSEAVLDAVLETPQARRLLMDEESKAGIEATKQLYKMLTGFSGAIEMADDEGMVITGFYYTDTPRAAVDQLTKSFEMMVSTKLMSLFSTKLKIESARDVERIVGRDAEVYTILFDAQDEEIRKAMHAVYGEQSQYYVAPCAEGAAYTMGPGDAGRDALARLLDRETMRMPDDKRILAARKSIAPRPQMYLFMDLGKLVSFGTKMLRAMGEAAPPPLELSDVEAPLVAFGIYLNRDSMRSEMFVPTRSVKQVIDAMKKLKGPHHGEPVAQAGYNRTQQ